MKQNSLKKHKKDWVAVLLLLLFTTLLFIKVSGILQARLTVPLLYLGHDSKLLGATLKTMLENTWYGPNAMLGAPLGTNLYDFPSYGDTFFYLCLKGLLLVFGNIGAAFNVAYYGVVILSALSMYFVLRNLTVRPWVAVLGGIIYTFAPYRFLHGTSHFFLICYFFLPLVTLFYLWLLQDDSFLRIQKGFFRYRRNIFGIAILMLFAISGIYYAYFGCFFFIVTLLVLFLRAPNKWQATKTLVGKAVVFFSCIAMPLLLAYLPTFFYLANNGANALAPNRSVAEASIYGLRLASLFIPPQGYNIPFFTKLGSQYQTITLAEQTEYLGLFAMVGFVLLLAFLLVTQKPKWIQQEKDWAVVKFLSQLNIVAILLGVVTGFGTMVSWLITPQIRAYTRISIFIAGFSIIALCVCINAALPSVTNKGRAAKGVLAVVLCALFGLSVAEPLTYQGIGQQEAAHYSADRDFIQTVEANVAPGSMVLQFPYVNFPENPPVYEMKDYELFRGYLHSSTLRWSYGAYKGRPSAVALETLQAKPTQQMLQQAAASGFTVLYIDKRGYEPAHFEQFIFEIEQITGAAPLISWDETLYVYNIKEYAETTRAALGQKKCEDIYNTLFGVVPVAAGTSNPRITDASSLLCNAEGNINFYNSTNSPITIQYSFHIHNNSTHASAITFTEPEGQAQTHNLSSTPGTVSGTLTLAPGNNLLHWQTSAPGLEDTDYRFILYDFTCSF
ncbi:hypothetical protein LJC61_03470 [Ruminococcaceae bacterium OttesenSCG-928-A16]|nr:hypothetical protein [Ruminococcaceae bacterium OttesenSCG-928-A16]